MFLFFVFFLKRGNGLTAKMQFTGMTRRTKEKIEIHEELWLFNIGDDNEIRTFNFITFD